MKRHFSYLLIATICNIIACGKPCPQPAFFDRVPPADSIHKQMFSTDTVYCGGDTAGYRFIEYGNHGEISLGISKKFPYLSGKIFLQNNCIYLVDSNNTKPVLLFPFLAKGHTDTMKYKVSARSENSMVYHTFNHPIIIDDVFYDQVYNDTIYKIVRVPDTSYSKRMFEHYDVFFMGKHVGLVGYVEPFIDGATEEDSGELLLLYWIGNSYAKKYNYSLRPHNYL